MGFPLVNIHGPWGPLATRIITVDISTEDFEDDDGFFIIPAVAGTLTVTMVDAIDTDPDIEVPAVADETLILGGSKFPTPLPLKKVTANGTVGSIQVLYPASGSD